MWFADTFHYNTLQIFNLTTERVCVCMVVVKRRCGGEGVPCYGI